MMNPRRALIPGSFDPLTVGHYDLVMRAARMFDEVYVTAFINSSKNGFFTAEQRLCMLKAAFEGAENIHVDSCDGLLADYAREKGIGTIVKGARSGVDFEYEQSLALINRSLDAELDTVIIPTKAEYMHVSSTMVRELIRYGRDFCDYVPGKTCELMAKYLAEK